MARETVGTWRGAGVYCEDRPLGGTRRVGGLLGVAGRLSGTVSPFRAEQGLIPSAQRLVWAAKQPLGSAALGALFA